MNVLRVLSFSVVAVFGRRRRRRHRGFLSARNIPFFLQRKVWSGGFFVKLSSFLFNSFSPLFYRKPH